MTQIQCRQQSCISCCNDICQCKLIMIDEDGICSEYKHYLDSPEYQTPYYICVKTIDGQTAKGKKNGRRLIINGVEFFTESHPSRSEEFMSITHARTGVACSSVKVLKGLWKKFLELQKGYPDVDTLPLAEYSSFDNGWVIKK